MKKAVVYGAGNIGRGFIGQLFSRSGYEVVFIDVNTGVVDALNASHAYPIEIIGSEGISEVFVHNVRAVNGTDVSSVAAEIAAADLAATAVGVNALPHIAKPLALGLRKRWSAGIEKPLNVILCENLIHADRHLEALVKKELAADEASLFDARVGLVEASIGRMVPVMTDEMRRGNALRIRVEAYGELPVDKNAFKGDIPAVAGMTPFSPFEFYIQRKLFIHNLGHACIAYLGSLSGYRLIAEAVRDPYCKLAALQAMLESAMALSLEHAVHPAPILDHVNNLLARFANARLGDTVERVGRDPLRKLSREDRLAGAVHLCGKHNIPPVATCAGIAAGLNFAASGDPSSDHLAGMIARTGVEKTIVDLCGITPDSRPFTTIIRFYSLIRQGATPENIIDEIERIRETQHQAAVAPDLIDTASHSIRGM